MKREQSKDGLSKRRSIPADSPVPLPEDNANRSVVWNAPIYKTRMRIQEIPRKTVMLSSFLFVGGVSMITIASICQFRCEYSLGLWVMGSLMILPGVYSMFILLNFIRGIRGYHYSMLPHDDD